MVMYVAVDLSVLGNVPHLLELDVSNNSIKTLLGFTAPKNLVSVNFSFNEISEIGDLSEHHALQYLFLDSILFPVQKYYTVLEQQLNSGGVSTGLYKKRIYLEQN